MDSIIMSKYHRADMMTCGNQILYKTGIKRLKNIEYEIFYIVNGKKIIESIHETKNRAIKRINALNTLNAKNNFLEYKIHKRYLD